MAMTDENITEETTEVTETASQTILGSSEVVETKVVTDSTGATEVTEEQSQEETSFKAEDYDFNERQLSEDVLSEINDVSLDEYKQQCSELGISPEQAKKLLDFYDGSVSKSYVESKEKIEQLKAEEEKHFNESVDKLKSDLGGQEEFDKAVNRVNHFLASKNISSEMLDSDGFNNSPIGIALVNDLLTRLGEDTVPTNTGSLGSLANVKEELSSLTTSEAYFDFNHNDHQTTLTKVNALQEQLLKQQR